MNNVDLFLDRVCGNINCTKIHNDVKDELSEHINCLIDEYMSEGMEKEEAEKMALKSMGNPETIGEKLDKQHKPKIEWGIILLTFAVAFFGVLLMIFSAKTGKISLTKYFLYVMFGFSVFFIAMFFDYTFIYRISLPLYVFCILGIILIKFSVINPYGIWIGESSFLSLAVLMQLIIIPIPRIMLKNKNDGFLGVLKTVCFILLPIIFTIDIPGKIIVYLFSVGILLIVSLIKGSLRISKRNMLILGLIFACFCVLMYLKLPYYAVNRLKSFMPGAELDITKDGYSLYTVKNLLGSSGAAGDGLGDVSAVLPGSLSEYAIASVIIKFGWITGLGLILAMGLLIIKLFLTIKGIKQEYGFYLAISCFSGIFIKYFIGIFMNLGFIPSVGISIPLISYGGGDYFVTLLFLGIILSVYRRNNILPSVFREKERSCILYTENGKLIIDFKLFRN